MNFAYIYAGGQKVRTNNVRKNKLMFGKNLKSSNKKVV